MVINAILPITIRPASPQDNDAIWEIFHQVGKDGDTYAHTEDTTKDEFKAYWLNVNGNTHTYVAEYDGKVAATFMLQPNRLGRGSHVANGAFMVHPGFRRQGIGKTIGQYAIDEARRLGFKAMQYNFVVSTNEVAIKLWQSLGFNVIGTVPEGFRHARLGLVDALIMHRFL